MSRMPSAASAKAGGVAQQDHEASVHTPPAGRDKAPSVGPATRAKAPTVHDRIKLTPIKERIRDTRGHADDGDARNVLNQKKWDGGGHGYHPRRDGHYDSKEDRSPSPEPPGTHVFSWEIRAAPFPPRFH